MRRIAPATLLTVLALSIAPARAHEGINVAGSQSGGGQLIIHAHEDDFPFALMPAVGPLQGWAGDEPPVASVEVDDPRSGLFTLDPTANIVFEIISFENAFQLWPAATPIHDPGQTWTLGSAPFFYNPTWHINSADPLFNAADDPWLATFRVLDTTGRYTASDPVTIPFTAVPEPATLTVLLCLTLTRRSRRAL